MSSCITQQRYQQNRAALSPAFCGRRPVARPREAGEGGGSGLVIRTLRTTCVRLLATPGLTSRSHHAATRQGGFGEIRSAHMLALLRERCNRTRRAALEKIQQTNRGSKRGGTNSIVVVVRYPTLPTTTTFGVSTDPRKQRPTSNNGRRPHSSARKCEWGSLQ